MFMDEQPCMAKNRVNVIASHNAKGLHAKGDIQISLVTDHYNEHTMQKAAYGR